MEAVYTAIPTQPQDTSVTVQAAGSEYLVTVTYRHPDGLRELRVSALVPKTSRDLADLEAAALAYARKWLDALAATRPF